MLKSSTDCQKYITSGVQRDCTTQPHFVDQQRLTEQRVVDHRVCIRELSVAHRVGVEERCAPRLIPRAKTSVDALYTQGTRFGVAGKVTPPVVSPQSHAHGD